MSVPLRTNLVVGVTSVSAPDLVDALDGEAIAGMIVQTAFAIESDLIDVSGITTQPSAATMRLANTGNFTTGVAFGRPGPRLLSTISASLDLSSVGPLTGADARPFDLLLAWWNAGTLTTSFDLTGGVSLVEAPVPLTEGDLAAFGDGSALVPRPALDATDEIDVAVPRLRPGHDAAFVALYADVPRRGFVLLALRFVTDADGSGLIDPELDNGPGTVRLFVPPTLWTAGRELVVVAGSQRRDDQREGRLATDRVSARVTGPEVVLPAFATHDDASSDGLIVSLPARGDAMAVIHGDGFRVYVPGDAPAVDLAALGFDAGAQRVWMVAATPSFLTGARDAVKLAAPPSSRATIFSAADR